MFWLHEDYPKTGARSSSRKNDEQRLLAIVDVNCFPSATSSNPSASTGTVSSRDVSRSCIEYDGLYAKTMSPLMSRSSCCCSALSSRPTSSPTVCPYCETKTIPAWSTSASSESTSERKSSSKVSSGHPRSAAYRRCSASLYPSVSSSTAVVTSQSRRRSPLATGIHTFSSAWIMPGDACPRCLRHRRPGTRRCARSSTRVPYECPKARAAGRTRRSRRANTRCVRRHSRR